MCGLRTRRDFWIHDDLIGGETIYQSSNWHRRGAYRLAAPAAIPCFVQQNPKAGYNSRVTRRHVRRRNP